jgi:hypothetical protein
MEIKKDDAAMLAARRIVEAHIAEYGYIDHPDILKEAIAGALRRAAQSLPKI